MEVYKKDKDQDLIDRLDDWILLTIHYDKWVELPAHFAKDIIQFLLEEGMGKKK